MNKQTMSLSNYISGKLFIALLASLLMTGIAASAQNATENPVVSDVVVKHQGSIGNKEYFSVKVPNENGEKFSIKVKDADGSVIFHDIFNVKNFERSFQFEKLADRSKLTFVIRTLKDNKEQVFEINSKVFTIEQVEITKAK
jgi:hypothetical protein